MGLRRRSLSLLVGGCLALSGCSSPVTGGTGIFVEDGYVRAIVQMCPDATASSVSLTKDLPPHYFWESTTWGFDDGRSATADLGTVDDFLERVGDRKMQLQSNASYGVGGWVTFEAADIRGLRDGEILSYGWSDSDSEVFDKVGFVNEALMYCPGG